MIYSSRTIIKHAIENDISSRGETFIGSGLQMAVQMFNNRQMKNPLGALLLLTDGRDSRPHDYNPIMQTLPDDIQCHTFGYGSDHTPALLAQLADQGHGGTFTYIVSAFFEPQIELLNEWFLFSRMK